MTLEKLCQEIRIDFANKEKQEIRSRNRLALFCFGSIIVLAAFAFVINLAFDMQGMAYVPLVPICFVLFLWYSWKAAPSIRKIKGWQEISSLFDEVPSDPNLHFQRILYAVNAGMVRERCSDILDDLSDLLERHPTYEAARLVRAKIFMGIVRTKEAFDDLEQIIKQKGRLADEARLFRDEKLEEFQNSDKEMEEAGFTQVGAVDSVVAVEPRNDAGRLMRAKVFMQLYRNNDALKDLDILIEKGSDQAVEAQMLRDRILKQ